MSSTRKDELKREKDAFEGQLETLLPEHEGKWALVKNGKVDALFASHEEAYESGLDRYGLDGVFLIAEVKRETGDPVSLSWAAGVLVG